MTESAGKVRTATEKGKYGCGKKTNFSRTLQGTVVGTWALGHQGTQETYAVVPKWQSALAPNNWTPPREL